MNATTASTTIVATGAISKWAAIVALLIGLGVVYTAGFASPMAIHNATHDTRHAFGLPCH